MASTALDRIRPRSATAKRFHSACALRAAATAASISLADDAARRTTSRPSTGEMQTMSGISAPLSSRKPRSGYPGPIFPFAQVMDGSRVSLRSPGMTAAFASIPLKSAHQFPVGDAAVVFELLPLRGVDVVVD